MNAAVTAPMIDDEAPYPLPPQLAEIRRTTDWEGFLPARARTRSWKVQQVIKRVLDVVLAAVLLVLLSPVFLVVALVVAFTSEGPVFYQWRALGKNGRPFIGHKFRTMVVNADELKASLAELNEMTGPVFKVRKDPRITKPGTFLRKYSLDELPQLWSVIKGDMSLVGPRPPTAEEFMQYEPRHRGKLSVIPGITCIWQVNGRNQIQDFEDWMELDRQYIQNWNLWLDARLLVATLPAVLTARGAS